MNAKGEKPMVVERGGDRPVGCIHLLTEEISGYVDHFFRRNFHLKMFQETKERYSPEENCFAPQVNILGAVPLPQP